MAITVTPNIPPNAPVPPATPNTVASQLFTATAVTGAGSPAQYAIGDVLERTVVYSGSTVASTTWKNTTKGTTLTVIPPGLDIAAAQTNPLTNEQLRAAPVKVEDDKLVAILPPSRGPQTDAESLSVYVSNQPTDSLRIISSNYIATADDAINSQYVTGQYLQRVQVFDIATTPVSLSSDVWTNISTNVTLTTAPDFATIEFSSSGDQALTDNQLRASAIHVVVDNMPAPVTPQTALQTYIDSYTAISGDTVNTPAQYAAGDRLRNTVVVDTSANPVTIESNVWENITTGATINAPAGATIAQTPASGLTDSELRASAVHVIVDNQVTLPASATVTTQQTVFESYIAQADDAANGEYVEGDILDRTLVLDTASAPAAIVSNVWKNTRTGLELTVPPSGASVSQIPTSGGGLTNTELRAAPVEVFVVNQLENIPGVVPAADTQTFNETYEATAGDTANTPAQWTAGDVIVREVVVDNTTTPPTVTYNYYNSTTGQDITGTVPTTADLTQVVQTGLTDAELRANPVEVYVINQLDNIPGVTPAADTQTFNETYEATAADTTNTPAEWSAGDVIIREVVVDNTTTPPTVTYNYYNSTTGADITGTAPTAADLTQVVQTGLTNAELRAEAIHVIVDNQVTIPGPAPAENVVMIETFTAVADSTEYKAGDILRREVYADTTVNPYNILSEEWYNLTQGVLMTGVPTANTIAAMPNNSLTDAELRATPVEVYVTNQPTPVPAATSYQFFSDSFVAQAAGTGYSAGDSIVRELVINTATGATVSETWKNLSTGATLTGAPAGTDIAQSSSTGLTDAQLRATAIHVIVDNQVTVPPSTDISMVVETYTVISSGTGYTAGDIVKKTSIVDGSTNPPTVTDTWENVTTSAAISAPAAGHIAEMASTALTDAELRATPVEVFVVNQPTPVPSPTQFQTYIDAYTAIAADAVNSEYVAGDRLQNTVTVNTQTNVVTENKWVNATTGVTLTSVPAAATITAMPDQALTDAQLRASAIHVIVDNQITTENATSVETVVTTYTAISSASFEYSVNDVIQSIEVVDNATTPVTITSTQWKNVTRNLILPGPPVYSDLALMSSSALTNAELRASPIEVFVTNQPSPVISATSNQIYTDSYTAITNDLINVPPEFLAGDRLRNVIVVNPATNPVTTISNDWYNVTQNTVLSAAPTSTSVAVAQTSTLTDEELRASAIHVIVDNQVTIPGPAATPNAVMIEMFTTIAAGPGYVAGDILRREVVADTTVTPYDVLSEEWYNVTQGALLTGNPSAGTIASIPNNGLSNAELRAAPIDVNETNEYALTDAQLRATPVDVNETNEYALTDAQLRASPVEVFVTNQPSPVVSPTTKQIYVDAYTALVDDATAPIEYSAGDRLQNIVTVETATGTVTDSKWYNVTTDLFLTQIPSGTTIAATPTSALTDSELRASAVHVIVDNQVVPGTSVTGKQMFTEQYAAIATGTGYTVGDVLTRTIVADTTVTPPVISSEQWYNVTTGAVIGTPTAGHIAQQASNPLTDAQLRASAIHVIVDNQVTTESSTSLTTVVKLYTTNKDHQTGTDYLKDEILSNTETVDSSITPPTVTASEWRNVSKGNVLIAVPDGSDLILTANNALTNAELRASDVNVNVTNHFDVEVTLFNVSQTGTGYTKGDVVKQITTYKSNGTSASTWFNVSTQQSITEPSTGHITIASGSSINTETKHYVAVASGTGVTTNDELERTVQWDNSQTPPTILSESWVNVTTGLALTTTPGSGTYRVYSGMSDKQKHVVSLTNVTEAAVVPQGAFEVSITNIGFANGVLEGATLPPGFGITYRADTDDYLEEIAFDATGTEFLVSIQLEINASTPNPGVAQPMITYPASGTTVPA